jgi:protein-S-isoprenylcysteine O-methyltransferase Ste14
LNIFLFVAWSTALAIVLELVIVCVGYICTMRLFDSHIRSTNPYLLGWLVTVSVYEPFNIVVIGRILKYRSEHDWSFWFADNWVAIPWGIALFASFVIWVWATVAFGLRWSNLTHRGIITDGPYRWTKHPVRWVWRSGLFPQ